LGGFFLLPAQPAFAATTQLTWLDSAPDTTSFRQATAQIWRFQDFGPHQDYQTEWWYTGNLETSEGRPFGFQLTFFRQALIPTAAAINLSPQSRWRGKRSIRLISPLVILLSNALSL